MSDQTATAGTSQTELVFVTLLSDDTRRALDGVWTLSRYGAALTEARVRDWPQAVTRVAAGGVNGLLFELSEASHLGVVQDMCAAHPWCPVVVIVDVDGPETVHEIIQAGAQASIHHTRVVDHAYVQRALLEAVDRHALRVQLQERTRELVANEANLRRTLEANRDAMLVVDANGDIRFANSAAARNYGTSPDDLVGQAFGRPTQDSLSAEVDIIRSDGTTGVAEMQAVPFQWRNIPATLITLHDITERRQRELEMRRVNAELERQNQELDQFTHTVSHDLKAPLNTIISYSTLIQSDREKGAPDRSPFMLDRIDAVAKRMLQTIDELLALTRIGRADGPMVEVDVAAILRGIVHDQQDLIQKLKPNFHVVEPLPRVVGDARRIAQAFANLVENALQHGCVDGSRSIQVSGAAIGHEVRFYVKDEGPGIPEEYHERVFDLFARLDPQREGTGIGLAIVKRVMERHHGRVWIESPADGGVAVCMAFPREPLHRQDATGDVDGKPNNRRD